MYYPSYTDTVSKQMLFYKFINILFVSLGLIPDTATNQFKSGFIFF